MLPPVTLYLLITQLGIVNDLSVQRSEAGQTGAGIMSSARELVAKSAAVKSLALPILTAGEAGAGLE